MGSANNQPSYCTAEGFLEVLRRVSAEVDWVWVDVAHIDQENPEVKADEIGRQAAIFNNARRSFIWLHHSPIRKLQRLSELLFDLAERTQHAAKRYIDPQKHRLMR